MMHSNLYLTADGNEIVQENGNASSSDQKWEIVEEGGTQVASVGYAKLPHHATVRYHGGGRTLTVSSGTAGPVKLLITDLQGRPLLHRSLRGTAAVGISGYASGMYIVSVQGNGWNVREPVVVK